MSANPPEAGTWLKPVGDVFLGLNASAVIQRVVGEVERVPSLSAQQIQGLTWQQFVQRYADESAQVGLDVAWIALAEKRVAPAYWPPYLPFKPGVVVRLRPVEDDPNMTFVAHLSTAGEYELLNALIGTHLLGVMDYTIRVGEHLFRGVDGPLTDLQVQAVGDIINSAGHTRQLLEDLRAAALLPAVSAPQPYSLKNLFAFSSRDFTNRRITTQRLTIHIDLPSDVVYCHDSIRDVVRRALDTLLTVITAETAITMSSMVEEETVQVKIEYASQEPAFQVAQRIEPLDLSDPARLETMSVVQRLVTAAQACLKPVSGRAWAEPHQDVIRLVLVLPRWKGALPEKPKNT
jgi:hypothetical protein